MIGATAGRPARLSRFDITAAAIALADRTNLDRVTMRAVATAVGCAPGALYRHFGDRGELLANMVDEALTERSAVRSNGVWRDDLAIVARQMFALHRRHPWLSNMVLPVSPGPRAAEAVDEVCGLLAPHPASVGTKYAATAVFLELVAAHARTSSRLKAAATAIIESTGRTEIADQAEDGTDEDYASRVILAAVGGILEDAVV